MPFHREGEGEGERVFKLSAGAAPLRRSCSALILAALSAAVAGAQPADNWIIETVAGGGSSLGDGGAATAARLRVPSGVAPDGLGSLYIADTGNNRIRKVDAAGAQFNPHILYAGAAPCCAGLYQFAVRLPDNLPDGNVPVTADVQGVSTPPGPFLAIQRR